MHKRMVCRQPAGKGPADLIRRICSEDPRITSQKCRKETCKTQKPYQIKAAALFRQQIPYAAETGSSACPSPCRHSPSCYQPVGKQKKQQNRQYIYRQPEQNPMKNRPVPRVFGYRPDASIMLQHITKTVTNGKNHAACDRKDPYAKVSNPLKSVTHPP